MFPGSANWPVQSPQYFQFNADIGRNEVSPATMTKAATANGRCTTSRHEGSSAIAIGNNNGRLLDLLLVSIAAASTDNASSLNCRDSLVRKAKSTAASPNGAANMSFAELPACTGKL